ncbi:hypothetical protein [Lentzea sp.]|uniref:hypothetical protein n=1 Tax=Lentzea sp. TaxID=56099 RepID=UPI002D0371DC|nr:hypothetical protein [Lentzea sp.]HUQ56253.1 hypothetical protein [Lentzea sp.]
MTTVVKILAPIALEALAKAAEALLAGAAYADKRSATAAAAGDDGSIITADTWQYCETNFASQWTPFSKRYNFPDGLIVDCYMVTAAAHDVDNNPAGVASYCFVAYDHAR